MRELFSIACDDIISSTWEDEMKNFCSSSEMALLSINYSFCNNAIPVAETEVNFHLIYNAQIREQCMQQP